MASNNKKSIFSRIANGLNNLLTNFKNLFSDKNKSVFSAEHSQTVNDCKQIIKIIREKNETQRASREPTTDAKLLQIIRQNNINRAILPALEASPYFNMPTKPTADERLKVEAQKELQKQKNQLENQKPVKSSFGLPPPGPMKKRNVPNF